MTGIENSTRVQASANMELSSIHASVEEVDDGGVLNRLRRTPPN